MILNAINLVIVGHCLIFGIFFLRQKGGIGRTNLYLAILMLLVAIMSFALAAKPMGLYRSLPYLVDLEWTAGFLFAPFYVWFIREMTGEKVQFTWKDFLHAIPALLAFLYFSKFYFKNTQEQTDYLNLIQTTYTEEYQIADGIFYTYIQGYFIYVIIFLSKRKKKVSGLFLDNLKWLRKYTLFLLCFGFLAALVFFFQLPAIYIEIIPLASSSLYLVLIYRFLQQSGKPFEEENAQISMEAKEPKLKYSGSNLNAEEADRLNSKLLMRMETDKVYLKQELTLNILAQQLGSSPHHLSQVINQYHQKNFSDFVNSYRIREAQRLILENPILKLEAVGYECGFNTKTTFNTAFKKISGLTPSEYRKQHASKSGTDL